MDSNGNSQPNITEFEMSEKEIELIKEIRTELGDLLSPSYDTDFNLRRWLIGWNYDLNKILPKLRKHMVYRKCMKLDDPSDTFEIDPVMKKYFPQCYFDNTTGHDDTLVQILCLGKVDIAGLVRAVSTREYFRARIYYTETCLKKVMALEKSTRRPSGMTHILDAEGGKFDSLTLKVFTGSYKDLIHFLQENFCEITNRVIVVNTSTFIYTLWQLIQPFLAQRTKDKVKILSSNWKTEILEFINPENLPPAWGGTMENWEDKLVIPEIIPEHIKYEPSESDMAMEMCSIEKYVARNSNIYEEIEATEKGQKIKWYFQSDTPVNFGVFYSEVKLLDIDKNNINTDDLEMVHPKFIVYTQVVPEVGEIVCTKPGYYYFEFGSTTLIFSQCIRLSVVHITRDHLDE